MKQTIIQIYGPSCAGKSTLIDNFLEQESDFVHLQSDKIKWFFKGYLKNKRKFKPVIASSLLAILKVVVKDGFSVIIEGPEELSQEVKILCKEKGINHIEINVEADFDIILNRFKERMIQVKARNGIVGNTSAERLRQIYDAYMLKKGRENITLDSGKMSEKEMLNSLKRLTNK